MRMLLLVIFGLMVASVLGILVKPFTSSNGRDSGAVKNGPIEQQTLTDQHHLLGC